MNSEGVDDMMLIILSLSFIICIRKHPPMFVVFAVCILL